jgi:hypothetical protein
MAQQAFPAASLNVREGAHSDVQLIRHGDADALCAQVNRQQATWRRAGGFAEIFRAG